MSRRQPFYMTLAAVLALPLELALAQAAAEPSPPPQPHRETVAITLDSGTTGLITSVATVSASTSEARPGNESTAEKTTVTSRADLTVKVSDTPDPAIAGQALSYQVTVANAGPSDARYVEVTATPSAGVTAVATHGCTEDPTGVPLCSLGTIPAGGAKTFTLEVAVGAATLGRITQQASVSSQTMEVKPGDESAGEETTVEAQADLAIVVADSADPMIDGRPMSYTMIVTNLGPSDAQGVTVADSLPAGVTFASTTGCAEDPGGAPVCTLGTIAAGTSSWYTLAVTVDAGTVGAIVNQVSVSAKTPEAKPGNELEREETLVEMKSALSITSSDSADPVVAGTSLTYTVKIANAGPSDALDVVAHDTLPAGVTFASTSGCGEDPAGVPTCTLGTIAAGTSKQYLLVMTVDPDRVGTLSNQARVTSTTATASSANLTLTEQTRVEARADLVISNRDSVDPVIAGTPLTYTVTVANNGPSDARNVAVNGVLPEGVTLLATEGCLEDKKPGGGLPTCTLETISAGTSKQYTVSVMVRPDATGVITNRANVTSSTPEARPGDEATPGH